MASRQECVAPRRPAVLFILHVLIGGHGQSLLLHTGVNARERLAEDLFSIALTRSLDSGASFIKSLRIAQRVFIGRSRERPSAFVGRMQVALQQFTAE